MTGLQFIARCMKTHNDKYDYSLTEYTGTINKVTIICPEHGQFKQKAAGHLDGKEGCKKCHRVNQAKFGYRLSS